MTFSIKVIDALMDGDLTPYPSYFQNFTGLQFYFNILYAQQPPDMDYFTPFVQLEDVRKSIHVGNRNFSDMASRVEENMQDDMYRSVAPLIVDILDAKEQYQVLIYSGQLDIIVANILTEMFLHKLEWHGAEEWRGSDRKIWRVGGDVAGYSRVTDNLTYVLVRNAGHMVPYDQPKWAFDMINRFTAGKPFA
jgi:vitellogenic carboxypeptidase-like protein